MKARRRAKIFEKVDERNLGDGDFVQKALTAAEEKMKLRYALLANGVTLESLAERVAELLNLRCPLKSPKS